MPYRRGDRWLATWRDHAGRRRTRSFDSHRLAEIYERQQRRNRDLVECGITSWQKIREHAEAQKSIDAVIDIVHQDLVTRGRTEAHCREFRRLCRAVLGTQLDRRICDLDAELVRRAVNDRRPTTARNRNAHLGAAKQIAGFALRHGWIDRDPLMHLRLDPLPLGGEVRRKRCILFGEFIRIIEDATVRERRRRTWYMLRFLTGLRGMEASRLRRRDIRQAGDIVYIDLPAESAKTGQPRLIPLVPELASELLQERAWMDADQLLWSRPPSRKSWLADIKRVGLDAEIRPSWIRLTFDVWMDEAGVSSLDQSLLTGRTGRGSSAISTWVYQDLHVALPRLDRSTRAVWELVRRRTRGVVERCADDQS